MQSSRLPRSAPPRLRGAHQRRLPRSPAPLWASIAAMNGVDMVTIAKLLGHALVEITAGYAHLADGHLVGRPRRPVHSSRRR